LCGVPALVRVFIEGERVNEGNYALIAIRSGWTPMILTTRVRL
jgi:hypothetical protein